MAKIEDRQYYEGQLAAVLTDHLLVKLRDASSLNKGVDLVEVEPVFHKPIGRINARGLGYVDQNETTCGLDADITVLRRSWIEGHTDLKPCEKCWG